MGRLTRYVLITFILFLGLIIASNFPEKKTEGGISCPITNGTYSFCFVRGGRPYYFSIVGWISPNATILEKYIRTLYNKYSHLGWGGAYSSYGDGIVLFLAIRTNLNQKLDWNWFLTTGEVLVNNLYKTCMLGCIDCWIRVSNDTFLVPYVLEINDCWESFKIIKEYYMNTSSVRLYFVPTNFLNLKENSIIKIGKITIVSDMHGLSMYIEYPLPNFNLSITNIKFLGKQGDYIFNITFRINNAGFITKYSFNEFGQKYALKEIFIPMYLLTVKRYPTKNIWVIRKLNKTHYLVAVPTATGHLFAVRYHFGGGFKDVWLEPQHEYIGSYASSRDTFWLEIEVLPEYVINDTVIFITPWGGYYKININLNI